MGAVLNSALVWDTTCRPAEWGAGSGANDLLHDNVRTLTHGAALGATVEAARCRGDYSGDVDDLPWRRAQNLLARNAFGDPAIRYRVGWGTLGN